MTDFLTRVLDFYRTHGWPEPASPAALLSQWQSFVEECEEGYSMGIYEYLNDIQCRSRIEVLLTAPELQAFPELAEFKLNVDTVDRRFRALLDPTLRLPVASSTWWERGVLRRAGQRLRTDLRERYGIDLTS